jgi:hypothetical protein
MECIKNGKNYLIPTKNWLEPIGKLFPDELKSENIVLLGKLIKKEKVIIKITTKIEKKLVIFDKILKYEPNFIYTYCAFNCDEDRNAIVTEYKNTESFCNNNPTHYQQITLEIIKRYNSGSLENFINSLDMNEFTNILKQLILSQINVFEKYGFLHNDLHLGNILTEITNDNNYELKYIIKGKEIIHLTRFQIVISDFDRSISYDPEVYNKYNKNFMDYNPNEIEKCTYDIEANLLDNIVNSIKGCCELLNVSLFNDIKNKLDNYLKNDVYYIEQHNSVQKILRNYYKKRYDYNTFKNKTLTIVIIIVNRIYTLISNDKKELTAGLSSI